MMKDDGPSPRVRISLTGTFHRPRQFEHEITGPTLRREWLLARRCHGMGKRDRGLESALGVMGAERGRGEYAEEGENVG